MFSTSDTIVAIATPPGHGGIGVIRISGAAALPIACRLAQRDEPFVARHATFVTIQTGSSALDHVIVTTFLAPHSYTGEDVAEISAHGSPVVLRAIVAEAMRAGARLANPGEFTFRAYLHGRLDLVQAEAVRDLVDAVTPLQARAAFDQLEGTLTGEIRGIDAELFDLAARLEASLDFPDEGYHFVDAAGASGEIRALSARVGALLADADRGRLIRDGLQVVLTGRPNSGKSSVFNRLAGAGRAIVTDVPGTTRDLITETIEVEGIPVTIVDTAGVRPAPSDPIEAEGIARATAARDVAALAVVVLDGSQPLTVEDFAVLRETNGSRTLAIANKSDLDAAWTDEESGRAVLRVSALTGDGFDALRNAVASALVGGIVHRDVPAVTNLRHADLLTRAQASLDRAASAALAQVSEEFVLADLNDARGCLEEISGARTPDDVLARIFSTFCIGK